MPKYAAIDIGTNAIKFYLAEKNNDGTWSAIVDSSEVTRLGEGLHATGMINASALERNMKAITRLVEMARYEKVKNIVAVGTMALRTANNAHDFIQRIKTTNDIMIEIISGEDEARLSFLAVTSSLSIPEGDFIIFDIGGGSTEFVLGQDDNIKERISLNIGVVRLTEQHLKTDPITDHEYELTKEAIHEAFTAIAIEPKVTTLIGVGATMTNLGAMKRKLAVYDPNIIHGSKLEFSDVEQLISLLKSKTIEERKQIIGLQPDRADVILPGAMIVKVIMKKMSANFVTISDRGVRHGLLIDRFG